MMGALATAFAPGKLIISGEHAVVHGHKALAVAVDRGCHIALHDRPGPSGIDRAPVVDTRLDQAVTQVLPPEGIGVTIESNLPIGRGMGSSAAMSIALVQALAAHNDRVLDFQTLHAQGFLLERIFHGNPSGIDHAVAALGGMLAYQKGPHGPQMKQVDVDLPPLVVLDSGQAGNTAEQVEKVRALGKVGLDLCTEIGHITDQILSLLPHLATDRLGPLLRENHRLLARLGVSTPTLDGLVDLAMRSGALGAKLAGAGGGGVVIAVAPDPQPILDAAAQAGYTAFRTLPHPIRMRLE